MDKRRREGRLHTLVDLLAAVDEGAVRRIRPKMMTVAATFFSLLPILYQDGAGSDVMRRIAAPMIGGVFTSFVATLIVLPAIYFVWRSRQLPQTENPALATSSTLDKIGARDENE